MESWGLHWRNGESVVQLIQTDGVVVSDVALRMVDSVHILYLLGEDR